MDLQPQQSDPSWEALQRNQFNLAKNAEHMRQYGETFRQLDEAAEEFYDSDDDEKKEDESERADVELEDEEKKEDNGLECAMKEGQSHDNDEGRQEGFERALPPLDNIKGREIA